jgi:hypothetical protein
MTFRTYTELIRIPSFEERFEYLSLKGVVGNTTFGFDRHMNQAFYRSAEWRRIRNHVIARDMGCDLGVEGRIIPHRPIIHHMNPMRIVDLVQGDSDIVDIEYLITTTHQTHNAIHYGDRSLLQKDYVGRSRGDTTLW